MSQLDSDVLKVNKNWAPVSVINVRKAFEDASAGAVTFLKFHEGNPTIYRLEDWLKIEPEFGEDFIGGSHGRRIAVPRVVICTNYDKLIAKEQRLNLKTLARRYNYICAVTGKPLTEEEYSREHVQPRSKGGKSGWDNEVLMDRQKNSKRGNRSYRKMGLRKPEILGAPPPLLPINSIVNRHGYPEWELFKIPRA